MKIVFILQIVLDELPTCLVRLAEAGEGEMHRAVALTLGFVQAEPGAGEKGTCFLRQLPLFKQYRRSMWRGSCFRFGLKAFLGKKHVSEFS